MTGRELTDAVLCARGVIAGLHIQKPAEILIEEIAFAHGAIVRYEALAGADGRLVRLGDRGVIRVRGDIPESGRRRFVIAHELGHLLLRHGADVLKLCDEQDLLEWVKGQRSYENEANEFAAELLMPEDFFRPRCQTGDPSLRAIERLADEFQTSLTATAVRYVEISSDRCAVVISQNGQIRWNRCSTAFPYWLLRRGPLHGYSYALDCVEDRQVPDYMSQVSATGWLPGLKRHAERTVWEQSRIVSRRLGVVLSLLWLPEDDD
jgi:Zn-dependent peptidase ImmA (M78 family)